MEYSIWKIYDYNSKSNSLAHRDEFKTTAELDVILELLKTDGNYHERIYNNSTQGIATTKIFFDVEVEGLQILTITDALLEIFKTLNLELKRKDIKYTYNDKKYKDGKKIESYHITIPKYYADVESQKFFITELKKYNVTIDPDVYNNLSFRLPNQTAIKGKDRKQPHQIINGKMKDFVIFYIDKSNSKNISKILKPKELKEKKTRKPRTKTTIISENILDDLLNGLTTEWLTEYSNWFQLGALLYNLDENYLEKFDTISSNAPNYKVGCCEKLWKGLKPNPWTIRSLRFWVKLCNPSYYETLNFDVEEEEEKCIVDTIKINKDYLTKLVNKELFIDDDIMKYCDDLFNTNIKSLNIKSPYGTSKTQLIKLIIQKYNPKKILWLSFRQTLSDDIHHHFKDLGFEHYLNGKIDSDRLIIQVESLMKIRQFEQCDFIDNICYNNTAKYDLIMLDEVESLLRQFNSQTTFSKNTNTRDTFEYLEELLTVSDKIISLDGDLNNRSYHFVQQFGEGIYLENLTTKNNKQITITQDEDFYSKDIIKSLKKKQKIVICSLATDIIKKYTDIINNNFPNLKVMYYTGKSDNKIKKVDFKDVNTSWVNYDVIMYTPTIEAGVSFEVLNHFNKIYGIINTNSCCQQAFFQMLSRVRNPKSNQILILNNGIYNPFINSKYGNKLFNFNEVKQSCIESRKELKIIYKDGKSTLGLDNYIINSIYNKVEDLNKGNNQWLTYFKKLGEKKGYTITIEDVERKPALTEFKYSTADEILETKDIDDETYINLLKAQKDKTTTEEDNIKILKKTLERQIGLKLNQDLVDKFYQKTNTIKNFSYLVDMTNFNHVDDSFSDDKLIKLNLINNLLQLSGVKIFNDDDCYKPLDFIEGVKNHEIFTTSSQILFGCEPKNNMNGKEMMKYLNTILENYNIKLATFYNGQREEKNKRFIVKRLNDIDEIMFYKKLRGVIKDTNNLIKKPDELKYSSEFSELHGEYVINGITIN